jgi:hypothetical protein
MATPGEFSKLITPYRIGLTMYEADEPLKLHPEWARNCQEIDHLVVPSNYCAEIFGEFVKNRPISVLPLATNEMYNVGLTYERQPREDGSFTFFSHGTLTNRKAPLEMLETFKKAFPRDKFPKVRMVFKTRLGIFGLGEKQLPKPNDDRITIYDADWFAGRLLQEFRTADAYVFPTKGEGWGMTPREAMKAGLPTIFSDNTALRDMADNRYNWPIPTKSTELCPLGGVWRQPDWDYLIDVMRSMVANPAAAIAKGRKGCEWMLHVNGAEAVSGLWKAALERVDPSDIRREVHPMSEVLSRSSFVSLYEEHSPFIKAITETVLRGSIVWDLGIGSGLVHAALVKEAYRVFGIAEPGKTARVIEAIRQTSGTPVTFEVPLIHLGKAPVPHPWPQALICQGVLQEYSHAEIQTILRGLILRYPGTPIIFSVPSINYPGAFSNESNLMSMDTWRYILNDFEISRASYYGPMRQHIFFIVVGMDPGTRGQGVSKRFGRIAEGVWRPATVSRF